MSKKFGIGKQNLGTKVWGAKKEFEFKKFGVEKQIRLNLNLKVWKETKLGKQGEGTQKSELSPYCPGRSGILLRHLFRHLLLKVLGAFLEGGI